MHILPKWEIFFSHDKKSESDPEKFENALGDPGFFYLPALPSSENKKPHGHKMAAQPPGFVSMFQAGRKERGKAEKYMPVGSVLFYQEMDNFSLDCYKSLARTLSHHQ